MFCMIRRTSGQPTADCTTRQSRASPAAAAAKIRRAAGNREMPRIAPTMSSRGVKDHQRGRAHVLLPEVCPPRPGILLEGGLHDRVNRVAAVHGLETRLRRHRSVAAIHLDERQRKY
jgi:hypothetical protein